MNNFARALKTKSITFRKTEDGFTIAEVMIAAIVILVVLLFTAYGLTSAFRASSTTENNSKANQLVNGVIALAEQSPYKQLYLSDRSTIDASLIGNGKCDTPTSTPSGTLLASTGDGTAFPGLTYCQTKVFGNGNSIGATFYIQTQIAWITSNGAFDSSSGSASAVQSGHYISKRVYVTVRWQDVSSGAGNWNTVYQTYTKTPSAAECVPDQIPFTPDPTYVDSNGNTVQQGIDSPPPGCSP